MHSNTIVHNDYCTLCVRRGANSDDRIVITQVTSNQYDIIILDSLCTDALIEKLCELRREIGTKRHEQECNTMEMIECEES